jgi:hypothetical protein
MFGLDSDQIISAHQINSSQLSLFVSGISVPLLSGAGRGGAEWRWVDFEVGRIACADLELPCVDTLKYLLGIRAGDHRVVKPDVLAFMLVDPGVAGLSS